MKFKDLSITFHTDKIKDCVDFYRKYFQAKVIFDASWYVVISFDTDSATSIILSFQQSCSEKSNDIFSGATTLNLLVEEVDACYEKVKLLGPVFVEDITDHEWGDRAFSFQDPIGNLLYIYSERPLHDKYKEAVKA